jgi:hypothetical protein
VLFLVGPFPADLVDLNRAAFDVAGRKLRAAGAAVLRPATPEPAAAAEWGDWMRAVLARMLTEADGVALLSGAGGLRSAGITCRLAHDLAIPVRTVPGWLTQLGQNDLMRRLRAGREAGD